MLRADARGLRQQHRLAAAELQRHRMLDRIHRQQPGAVAVDHGVRVHHLGVQARMRRDDAMEHAAVGICPVHHRGDGQAQGVGGDGGGGRHAPPIVVSGRGGPVPRQQRDAGGHETQQDQRRRITADREAAVVQRLHDAFKHAMEQDAYKTALARYDMVPMYMGSAAYLRFAQETFARERVLIERLGLAKPA